MQRGKIEQNLGPILASYTYAITFAASRRLYKRRRVCRLMMTKLVFGLFEKLKYFKRTLLACLHFSRLKYLRKIEALVPLFSDFLLKLSTHVLTTLPVTQDKK